jgi:DNA-binding LacI/PurR family transcriptional regulator
MAASNADIQRKPVRLVDVAASAGVSRAAASKVLLGTGGPNTRVAEDTRKRIQRVADQLGFRPNQIAQQLKGKRTQILGVIVGYGKASNLLYRLIDIEEFAYERGYRVILGSANGDARRAAGHLDDFLGKGVDGIIALHVPQAFGDQLFEQLRRCPHVVHQSMFPVPGGCCVMLDRAAGIADAVRHLADTGRTRIALALPGAAGDPSTLAKVRGYEAGLLACGLPHDPGLCSTDLPFEAFEEPGVVESLVTRHHADAIIASNDKIAIRLVRTMKRAGIRVPQDVAVVGFDNAEVAALYDPSITSIDQCNDVVARATVDLLAQSIADDQPLRPEQSRIVKPKLVVRESTAPKV